MVCFSALFQLVKTSSLDCDVIPLGGLCIVQEGLDCLGLPPLPVSTRNINSLYPMRFFDMFSTVLKFWSKKDLSCLRIIARRYFIFIECHYIVTGATPGGQIKNKTIWFFLFHIGADTLSRTDLVVLYGKFDSSIGLPYFNCSSKLIERHSQQY